jgi:hypothetical protein
MTSDTEGALLAAFSRGEISRPEVARRLGRDIDFAEMLLLLRAHGLKLPRPASDPDSPGVKLIRALAEAAPRG